MSVRWITTPSGEARVTELARPRASGLALLLHGAGSDTTHPPLPDIAAALVEAGVRVWSFDQPYRVAPGRRPPPPAATLDRAITSVLGRARRPLVIVGRSSGARVGCRTATAVRALGVVALGFPLRPPDRDVSRADELRLAGVPVVVVQGERDEFGTPADISALGLPHVRVEAVAGADHDFAVRRRDGHDPARTLTEVTEQATRAVLEFLAQAAT